MAIPQLLDADLDALKAVVENGLDHTGIPGIAIGLQSGELAWSEGFGVTNVEDPQPVRADTVFKLLSISKTFAATTAMRLVELGQLDLDQPIREVVAGFRLADADATARLTLRHCFSHSTGLLDDVSGEFGPGDDALARLVQKIGRSAQIAPPGTVWSYADAGICLAARAIESVTRMTYERAAAELVLEPLGMLSTGFNAGAVIGRRIAMGHRPTGAHRSVIHDWESRRCTTAAGGVATTIDDMLRYARLHLGHSDAEGRAPILSDASRAAMREPLIAANGTADWCGVGWLLQDWGNTRLCGHSGHGRGYQTELRFVPEQDFAVIVLVNDDEGAKLSDSVVAWTLERFLGVVRPDPTFADPKKAALAEYVGVYEMGTTRANVRLGDEVLQLHVQPGRDTGFHALHEGGVWRLRFVQSDRALVLDGPFKGTTSAFTRDALGRPRWLTLGSAYLLLKRLD
jgi:CubicO group peptidase (beta-lactamase class C family)